MAKARCERCGMPKGREKTYSAQPYLPVGCPDSGVICGRAGCMNPAFAWLTLDEERQYRDEGERAFQIGYFTVNPDAGEGFVDWQWLGSQPVVEVEGCVRHLHFEAPLPVVMNGKTSQGMIFKRGNYIGCDSDRT